MMKQCSLFLAILILLISVSCQNEREISSINPENWNKRQVTSTFSDSLKSGLTYLPVYSQIYGMTEHRLFDLTATVSMRNIDLNDTIFILSANYYNTQGEQIRTYIQKPVFLAPLETIEIVIDEVDKEGGTGANFIFNWKTKQETNEPFFECVMISASGQQGLSFATQGINIKSK